MSTVEKSNDDCYFYYYSSCNKGQSCGFRHESAALAQEVVCTFWKQGKCTKSNCIYRHMDLDKKRNVIPCFWEKQPVGCKKPHCPFLHDKPKDPYPEVVATTPVQSQPQQSKIIINKNKIDELKDKLILPEIDYAETVNQTSGGSAKKRLPIKARLGLTTKRGNVKDRLGGYDSHLEEEDHVEVRIIEEEELSDLDSEEEKLRKSAIQTLDLRKRLSKKDEEYDPERPAVLRRVKKDKKDKLKKKEKKILKKIKEGTVTKKDIKKLKKLGRIVEIEGSDADEEEPVSLADKIASQRGLASDDKIQQPAAVSPKKSAKLRLGDRFEDEENEIVINERKPLKRKAVVNADENIKKQKSSVKTEEVASVIADVDTLISKTFPEVELAPKNDSMRAVEELEALLN